MKIFAQFNFEYASDLDGLDDDDIEAIMQEALQALGGSWVKWKKKVDADSVERAG